MSAPRRVAIMRALVRPELWLGCDRTMLIALVTLVCVLVGPLGFAEERYWVAALGGLVFAGGMPGLRALAKSDPLRSAVYMRAKNYRHVYRARARWDIGTDGRSGRKS